MTRDEAIRALTEVVAGRACGLKSSKWKLDARDATSILQALALADIAESLASIKLILAPHSTTSRKAASHDL